METAAQLAKRLSLAEAKDLLRRSLPEGKTVYTLHVDINRTGELHSVSFFTVINEHIVNLSACIARCMDASYDTNRHAVRMRGGGLNMGHHGVDWVSRFLFAGDGRALKWQEL